MAFDGSTMETAPRAVFSGGSFSDDFILEDNDVDMAYMTLVGGSLYRFDVDNGTQGDLHLRIFDQFGAEVRANDDGFRANDSTVFSLSPFIEFAPNHTGTYYVAVSPYYLQDYNPFTETGRVAPQNPLDWTVGTLSVTNLGTNEFADSASIGAIVTEGTSDETDLLREEDRSHRVCYTGVIESPGDVDIGRMDLTKADVVVVDVNGLEGNGTVLRVFSALSGQFALDDDSGSGDDPELVFSAATTGQFYLGLSGDGNSAYNPSNGADTVAGATGTYEVILHRNPTLLGDSAANGLTGIFSNDYIVALAGNDTVAGGDGNDTLAGGDDQDSLTGGNGNDAVYGDHGNDTLLGDGGSDILSGGLGDDSLEGGTGTDLLEGGSGNDTLRGGLGASSDTLSGGLGNDSLKGMGGHDRVDGGDGDDTVVGDDGNDTVIGGAGIDLVQGGDGNDAIAGAEDNDMVQGGLGNDTVFGSAGDDSVEGNAGNDRLTGDEGNDSLKGGSGSDVFVFVSTGLGEGIDLVQDMALGFDRIDLSAIFLSAGSVVNAGNLSQFVQCLTSGVNDSFLRVDADGFTGGSNFVTIAQVIGITPGPLFDIDNFIV